VPFDVDATIIPEVRVVRPRRFADERGWFAEVFQAGAFAELGLPASFAQVNHSRSRRGVLRGRAFMVAADIRPGSPTLGRAVTVEASADEPLLFWAPASFARGFCALEDGTEIEYFCTAGYSPAAESGIRWDDPRLAIAWPVAAPRLSPKDAAAGSLDDWLVRPESEVFRYRA
jgi:dTDP-4-dehydrorhamnose 3,5-epimerase